MLDLAGAAQLLGMSERKVRRLAKRDRFAPAAVEADAEGPFWPGGDLAKYLGYKKTSFRVRGQPVFTNGKTFISQDIGSGDGSHSGGTWKIANSVDDPGRKSTRSGTTDALLNKIGC
ncbi:toxin C-terminal domain-containing protein [Amycolatopsis japonica]|uniref:toxin C-terminal domain-containing protein n=1 Tax=Amycolatopsis japonica TaxID=208439 RepID=UPI00366AFA1C